jgi:mono/diheme cytochrome c family protein
MKVGLIICLAAWALAVQPALPQEKGELFQPGQQVYEANCADCHRANGEGLPVKFPALAGNSLVTGAAAPVIATVLRGRQGTLGRMPAWRDKLDDSQVAAVVTYIRGAWSNKAAGVTPDEVAKVRGRRK